MTIDERRRREKDQRRDDIINAANRLFFLKGYERVSMDEIANEVELSKSTLYFYFKDKESLYFSIVNRGIKILRPIIIEEMKRSVQDGGFEVDAIHKAFNRFIRENPDYAQAYLCFRSGLLQLSKTGITNADAKEVLEFTEELIERAAMGTKTCIDAGIFRPDINPAILTAFNFVINESILAMSKDLRNMLEAHVVSMQQFYLTITNDMNVKMK